MTFGGIQDPRRIDLADCLWIAVIGVRRRIDDESRVYEQFLGWWPTPAAAGNPAGVMDDRINRLLELSAMEDRVLEHYHTATGRRR